MLTRRKLLCGAVIAGAVVSTSAFAADTIAYSPTQFDAAQKTGRAILVEIHASWCPTCKAQVPILAALEAKPEFKDLLVVRVDFDSQRDAVRRFGARMQSTLIVFKGDQEMGRSVGDTNPASIAALLNKAI